MKGEEPAKEPTLKNTEEKVPENESNLKRKTKDDYKPQKRTKTNSSYSSNEGNADKPS